jgi:hypothetical protein
MPVPKKKPTTSVPQDSMPEPSSPVLPNQEEFGQHVRRLAVSAVQEMTRTSHARRTGTVHRSFLGGMHSQSPWVSQWFLHSRFGDSQRA